MVCQRDRWGQAARKKGYCSISGYKQWVSRIEKYSWDCNEMRRSSKEESRGEIRGEDWDHEFRKTHIWCELVGK